MIGKNFNFIVDINELKRKYIFSYVKLKLKSYLANIWQIERRKQKLRQKAY